MNQSQYYDISRKSNCVLRCPILDYCTRRAFTIYFFSDFHEIDHENNIITALQKEHILPKDFNENSIPLSGEAVIWSKKGSFLYYYNMCPEVNLFDSENGLRFAKGMASCDGDWDNERSNKFINIKNKHYTECLEYNNYIFKNKTITKRKATSRRNTITKAVRFAILERDNHMCQYCGSKATDGVKLQVDHIIPVAKGGTDSLNNLITSCIDCNQGKSDRLF